MPDYYKGYDDFKMMEVAPITYHGEFVFNQWDPYFINMFLELYSDLDEDFEIYLDKSENIPYKYKLIGGSRHILASAFGSITNYINEQITVKNSIKLKILCAYMYQNNFEFTINYVQKNNENRTLAQIKLNICSEVNQNSKQPYKFIAEPSIGEPVEYTNTNIIKMFNISPDEINVTFDSVMNAIHTLLKNYLIYHTIC